MLRPCRLKEMACTPRREREVVDRANDGFESQQEGQTSTAEVEYRGNGRSALRHGLPDGDHRDDALLGVHGDAA